ncbi:hypothetical protein Bca4012_039119 [Brassica carinata]
MWGKGKRVEIHNNPLTRSMLVRIPSDYLRQKILEKGIWYIGDSMFHTSPRSSAHTTAAPSMEAIPIWAHLHGVPLDLRHEEGLSLVAGLVGEPKETDDFTKNLVSLTIAHVKVAMDLTKPAPDVVEFTRQSGEVVEVRVTYPWLPSTCANCKELGHISKNCLQLPPPAKQTPSAKDKKEGSSKVIKKTSTPVKHSAVVGQSTPSLSTQAPMSTEKELTAQVAQADSNQGTPRQTTKNAAHSPPQFETIRPSFPSSSVPSSPWELSVHSDGKKSGDRGRIIVENNFAEKV